MKKILILLLMASRLAYADSARRRLGFIRIGTQVDAKDEGIDYQVPTASIVYRIAWGGSATVYRIIPSEGKIFVLKSYKDPASARQDLKALRDVRDALKGTDIEFGVIEALGQKDSAFLKLTNIDGADLNEATQQIGKTDPSLSAAFWTRYDAAYEKTLKRLKKFFWRVRQEGAYIYYKRSFFCEERILLLKPDNILVRESDLALIISDPE